LVLGRNLILLMSLQNFTSTDPFSLESGKQLSGLEIAFHTYGDLAPQKNNVVWVCHALTANADVLEWWPGLFGEKTLFNPHEYFIICANILGSAYGTTNPLSTNPKLGGQQALEWAITEPEKIDQLIVLASNAKHSPWGIAFNESQRLSIAADPTFYKSQSNGGNVGLKAARSLALLSYRSYKTYATTQSEDDLQKKDSFNASSYQNYQGQKLVNRFNAYSYWYLTKAMDSHNVARNRVSFENALNRIKARTLIIAIASDILFPPEEQRFLHRHIPGAAFAEVESLFGHDGFLIETEALSKIIKAFINQEVIKEAVKLYRTA